MVDVLVILDGASEPWRDRVPTSLELARTPALDRLAREGELTRLRTVARGLPPGSEAAIPALLGWTPPAPVDRGALEAAAHGIEVGEGERAWRIDVLPGAALAPAARRASGRRSPPRGQGRARGRRGARCAREAARHRARDAPSSRRGLASCACAQARPATPCTSSAATGSCSPGRRRCPPPRAGPACASGRRGSSRPPSSARTPCSSAPAARPSGRRGSWAPRRSSRPARPGCRAATSPRRRTRRSGRSSRGAARVVVHVGGPDAAAHARDRAAKVAAIERADRDLIGPLAEAVRRAGGTLTVCPDHGCDPATGEHDAAAVPCVAWAPADASLRRELERVFAPPSSRRRLTERAVAGLPEADLAERALAPSARGRRPGAMTAGAAP